MVRALRNYLVFRRNEILNGRNLAENVKDAYDWLARKYQEGDQIYLFGRCGSSTWCSQPIMVV